MVVISSDTKTNFSVHDAQNPQKESTKNGDFWKSDQVTLSQMKPHEDSCVLGLKNSMP